VATNLGLIFFAAAATAAAAEDLFDQSTKRTTETNTKMSRGM